ncbi:MAG: hypothetical protein IJ566_01400 [Cardiobacteriaceae bacterium]|nr:hypothetical protein [Cardiobacteriaceae bacterium]
MNEEEYLNFAEYLANRAREISMKYFRANVQEIGLELKSDCTPVSIADRKIEELLRSEIEKKYPSHAICGEEFAAKSGSEFEWIIDPIDGTKSFISGFPIFCTLIALLYQNKPLISVIDAPAVNNRFTATLSTPSKLNGQIIRSRDTQKLNQAFIYSTSPDSDMFNEAQKIKQQKLKNKAAMQRYTGDGYSYGMLAAGWIDLVVEADMKFYDFMPLVLIVKQAGGVISDWQGGELNMHSSGEIIAAANKTLHQQALEVLNL